MEQTSPQTSSQTPPKKKPVKVYIFLIVLPFILILLAVVLQIVVQFTFNKVSAQPQIQTSDNSLCAQIDMASIDNNCCPDNLSSNCATANSSPAEMVLRVIQLVLGTAGVMLLLLEPLWIILLVLAIKYNNEHFPQST